MSASESIDGIGSESPRKHRTQIQNTMSHDLSDHSHIHGTDNGGIHAYLHTPKNYRVIHKNVSSHPGTHTIHDRYVKIHNE